MYDYAFSSSYSFISSLFSISSCSSSLCHFHPLLLLLSIYPILLFL